MHVYSEICIDYCWFIPFWLVLLRCHDFSNKCHSVVELGHWVFCLLHFQLAALDFIGCAAADVFAMTDSGSQFASLVSGYRMYYGVGKLPTIRPNQRRLADIFSRNATIGWKVLELRVRKTVKEYKLAHVRPIARSIYRHPRCQQCMCKLDWLIVIN